MSVTNLSPIKNEPNLRKDEKSGVVVNVSSDEYHKYLKKKELIRNSNSRLDRVESELNEVKDLLRSVVEKLEQE